MVLALGESFALAVWMVGNAPGARKTPCEQARRTTRVVYGDDNDNGYYADALPTIYAGDGNDTVGSASGFLLAYGGNGADTLCQNGTGGLDAFGGYGNDYLIAANSTNSCFLYGEEGSDIVIGGTLSDDLDGGRGNDYLAGEAGNDTYLVD